MTNYQHILREDNTNKLSTRGVNTSFLLFPIRLETKFKEKTINDIDEQNKAYYIFCALWAVLRLIKNSPEDKILKKIKLLREEIEKTDLLLKSDKAHLLFLIEHIGAYLKTEELKKAWSPLKDILAKAKTSKTISDKKSTIFLNKMDKMSRKLVNTIDNPPFLGKKRFDLTGDFSQTICLRTAMKNFKECHRFLLNMEDEIKAIPDGITKEQVSKFCSLIIKWEDQLDNVYVIVDKELKLKKKNLLEAYSIDEDGNYHYDYGFNVNNSRLKYINDYVKILYKFVNDTFLPALKRTNYAHLASLMNAKVKYGGTCNSHYICPQRYTTLASSLLYYYMRHYIDNQPFDKEKLEKKIRSLSKQAYFNYKTEKKWATGILKVLSKKLCLDVDFSDLNTNDHFMRKSQMCYVRKEKCLCVRIYPDVVALSKMAKPLTSIEFQSGKDFWLKYALNNNEAYRSSLWQAICDLYDPHRAAYILKKTYPTNYVSLLDRAKNYKDSGKNEEELINGEHLDSFFDSSSIVESNESELFDIPVTNLMPERFALHAVLNLSPGKKQTLWHYGRRIPSQLQVGLDLNHLNNAVNEDMSKKSGQLYLNGSLRWMTDYDAAEQMGMAITLPLKALEKGRNNTKRKFDFDAIYVYGIHEASSDECSRILLELMEGRMYSKESMELISSDMPTNILTSEDEDHKYDSSIEAQKERFKHIANNCVKPIIADKDDDARIIEDLLCIKESFFTNLSENKTSTQKEINKARKVNKYLLELIDNPIVKLINNNKTLKYFFINDVLPRGPFPFMRISNQPYGILPVCDFNRLTYSNDSIMDMLKKLIILLTKYWNNIVDNNNVAYDGDKYDGITDKDYLNILNNTPSTTTFWKRKMIANSDLIKPEYFRNELKEGQLESIRKILDIKDRDITKQHVKDVILDYNSVPLIDTNDDGVDKSVIMSGENISLDKLVAELHKKNGLSQEEISSEKLRQHIIEFFDLFNYRLDAWLTGMLSNKLRKRMNKSNHNISLGCFGWIFNLKESDNDKAMKNNEYILAPSVNQAITGAILRSSYNNSMKDDEDKRDYSMNVNLSSERVRSAMRIIEGVQNGQSVGCILGADLERLLHEAYKVDSDYEMDFCIYPLRGLFPLVTQNDGAENDITVLNGMTLLNSYRKADDKHVWLRELEILNNVSNVQKKEEYLLELIDRIDDEFDALTDLMLSESVYKLTQGNMEAVNALTQAMDNMKNIPMPEVANIPITSAQIDGHMIVALDIEAQSSSDDILSNVEPKVNAWIEQTIGNPSQIGVAFTSTNDSGESVIDYMSLEELGISSSEMVYLSADTDAFDRLLNTIYWMKEGSYPSINRTIGAKELSLQDVQFVSNEMRKMLSDSRMLRNDDMIEETGHASKAEYDNLESSYRIVHDHVLNLTQSMQDLLSIQMKKQNPDLPDYNSIAMSNDEMKMAINMMIHCFRLGQLTSLDGVDPNLMIGNKHLIKDNKDYLATVEKQHIFFQKVSNMKDNLLKKLNESEAMIEQSQDPTYKEYQNAISHLLLSNFLTIPAFKPDEHVNIDELKRQCSSNIFTNVDDMDIEDLLSDMSKVEEPMMHLHQIRMYAKCNDMEIADILPVQFPIATGSKGQYEWLGVQVSDESMVNDAFVYMVMNPEKMLESLDKEQKLIAGMVIDHWIERIPFSNQTAAVAFNYDQPDSEAPQTLLLAVSTKDYKRKWSNKMMLNTMKSAGHMIRCRAVNPEMLSNNRWTSGIFPLIEYKDIEK